MKYYTKIGKVRRKPKDLLELKESLYEKIEMLEERHKDKILTVYHKINRALSDVDENANSFIRYYTLKHGITKVIDELSFDIYK